MSGKLTPKQEAFCLAYFASMSAGKPNAAAAYREAFDCNAMKDASVYVEASRLLDDPNITLRLQELGARAALIAERRFDVTVDRIAQELASIAFFDPRELFDEGGNLRNPSELPRHVASALHKVKVLEEFEGRGKSRKLSGFTKELSWHDKTTALTVLAKWRKMLIDHIEHGKPGDFDHLSDTELDAEIAAREEARAALLKASQGMAVTGSVATKTTTKKP